MCKISRIREDIMINSKRVGRTPSQERVAGNGLIDRRVLLGHGIAIAGAMSTAGTITGAAAEPLKDPAMEFAVRLDLAAGADRVAL